MLYGKWYSRKASAGRGPGSFRPSVAILGGVTTSLVAASALAVLAPSSAPAAVIVEVDGLPWVVRSTQITLANYVSLLDSQPWFNNRPKAEEFANAVGQSLGYPNQYTLSGARLDPPSTFEFESVYGPVFVFQGTNPVDASVDWGATVFGPRDAFPLEGSDLSAFLAAYETAYDATITLNGGAISYVGPLDQWEFFGVNSSSGDFIATANLLSKEVPAPLPIFGVSAAFGFSRQLRRRIRGTR
jgi:hypothetical protein